VYGTANTLLSKNLNATEEKKGRCEEKGLVCT